MSKRKSEDPVIAFLEKYEEPVGKIIEAIAKRMETAPRYTLYSMLVFFAILGFIVFLIYSLTMAGYLTSEGFSFLIGSIVGYVFALFDRYIGPRRAP